MAKPFLWIALDGLVEAEHATRRIAKSLHSVKGDFGFKVNLDYVVQRGIHDAVHRLPDRPIFADLKMFNGARTMASAFAECDRAQVTATNACALAGGGNSRDEGDELKKAIATFRESHFTSEMEVFAVSVMTHYGPSYAHRMHKLASPDLVCKLAEEAANAKADGLILPGKFVPLVKHFPLKLILPALRFDWFKDSRHSEEIYPHDLAAFLGCKIEVVCGSPIMKSADPVEGLERVLDSLPDLG